MYLWRLHFRGCPLQSVVYLTAARQLLPCLANPPDLIDNKETSGERFSFRNFREYLQTEKEGGKLNDR